MKGRENTESDFWKNINIKGDDFCWEWKLYRDKEGYGNFKYQGKTNLAHRIAYALANNVPIENLDTVRHTCDNPGCCNPKHLINGTNLENMQDMVMKGRRFQPLIRGEQHYRAKLTESQVLEIRKRYANGEKQKILAINYEVNQSHISDIVNNKKWGWL